MDPAGTEHYAKELAYYKHQVDNLAGEVLRLDYTITGLRHALEQKRKGYQLLDSLVEPLSSEIELSSILEIAIQQINSVLGMDRSVVLIPAGDGYQPASWVGFTEGAIAQFSSLRVRFPPELISGGCPLRITRASAATPLSDYLREAFELPFFICVPIRSQDSTLAILLAGRLREARPLYPPLDQGDVDTLQAIASLISAFARLRHVKSRIEAEVAKTRVAATIQLGLLPKASPQIPRYDMVGKTVPAQIVGGDYFDFIPIDENRWAVCLGDISGKGLPAALLMANLQASIRGQTLWTASACDCMSKANRLLYRSTDPTKFATLFYGVLNVQSNWMCYSNAGHNPPLLFSGGGEPARLASGGTMIGLFEHASFQEEAVSIMPNDVLVIYSDGITEAESPEGEEFGEGRLVALVNDHRDAPVNELAQRVLTAVEIYSGGAPQADDMTLLVLKRTS